ncbi:MAG: AraC family transcriptional regulator [Lachnospiraceae bacterium]|nr:AraC family transcriptional regulator [Agathobacter sp.]MDD6444994.1 AraC family transcriptional regulator [Lachnospiraceae bacterium]MDY4892473.1 AraC family transcriptional regulator [Agathobacter sp.]
MNILEYENYHETVSHGDIVFPYNTYLCSIPLDFPCVPLHWHDEMELIYIKKGIGRITVDFREYKVTGPSLVLILPGQLHSIDPFNEEAMEYENIIFSPNMLVSRQNDVTATDFLLPLITGKITVPTVFTPVYPYYEDIIAPIDACDEICKTKPQGYELYVKSQLFQFFFILDNRCRNLTTTGKNKKTLDKMKIVLKYIENNYMQKITIGDIAAAVGFSESHFMRYFKETMGTSFVEYLRDYRLTIASRLLTSSDSSILNIAAETGFENLSYFNRVFKEKYKMTPRQFRKESRLNE